MRRVLFAFLLLLLGGLTATAWYAYDKGFTKKWRGFITEEFRKQGFEVSLKRLTLDPFRGLVAKEVKIFDAKNRRRTLAVVDEVLLGINYAEAVQGNPYLETLDLRDANLSLPVNPSNPRGESIEISKLNARLFLPPQQIYLARAEAEVAGLRVYAAGRLINPQAFSLARGEKKEKDSPGAKLLEQIIDELNDLTYEGERPLVAVQFSGDLAQTEKIWIDVRVQGGKIRRRDYRLETIDLAATLREGRIELQRCDLRDTHGLLQAYASYVPQTRAAELRMRSSMNLPGLIRSLKLLPELREWAFYVPPQIELEGRGKFTDTPKFELIGNVELQKFAYKSVIFDGLKADTSWQGERWSVRNLDVRHYSGELRGDLMQVPGNFRAYLKSTIDPKLISPLLSGKAAEWFSQFNFGNQPGFEIDVKGPSPTLGANAAADQAQVF